MSSCVSASKNRTVICCWRTLRPLNVSVSVLELNVCWNSDLMEIFGFAQHESVRALIFGLSVLDFLHLRTVLSYQFLKHALCISDNVLQIAARLCKLSRLNNIRCSLWNWVFALLNCYNSPFVVVFENRYCKLSYFGVSANFISVTV